MLPAAFVTSCGAQSTRAADRSSRNRVSIRPRPPWRPSLTPADNLTQPRCVLSRHRGGRDCTGRRPPAACDKKKHALRTNHYTPVLRPRASSRRRAACSRSTLGAVDEGTERKNGKVLATTATSLSQNGHGNICFCWWFKNQQGHFQIWFGLSQIWWGWC